MNNEEEKLMRSVALQNAQSILQARQRAEQELVRTKEALEEETRILELLNDTGAMLASNLELQRVVQAVTDAGTKLSGAAFGAFFYTDGVDDDAGFTLFTLSGAPREAFEKLGRPRPTGIFGPTFRGEGIVRIADVRSDPRYGQMGPHFGMPAGHLPVCSYLAVPVLTRTGKVIGGLFFGHPDCNVFNARSERLIGGIAAQAAIAIDNARLYEEARRAADERARMLEDEREVRAEIERISLMKDEFLATLSHELRTPLNAVLGWAGILLRREDSDRELHHGLETIARNARAQAQLIDDLLDMSRIVSGKIRLDVQRFDLCVVVEAALESVRPSAEGKAIALRATLDPHAGPLVGDPHRLQQVIWNLLSNAVKFTPKGGKIDVLVQRVNSHVEVTVHDTGMGISTEFLPHLFERFRQADSSTTRKFGGLGLGLSIVKQLVELHGGSVTAESAGEGQGATFIVSLPLRAVRDTSEERVHPTAKATSSVIPPPISLAGVKVLIVDDDSDARELIKAVVTQAAAEPHVAASACEALAALKRQRPDVIVSDIGMPERDGYQFIGDVRSLPTAEGGRTPAIALTAFARSEDRTRAMLSGYQVHVAKPIEPQELVAAIKSLCSHLST
jgi:signal transduction histidine kinase/ActR/RegA family two-component response regulator